MSHELQWMENTLLQELASSTESIRSSDLAIRQSVETACWDDGLWLSSAVVDRLQEQRIICATISAKLTDPDHAHRMHAAQIQRCRDMSTHLLEVISKQLTIYQRIVDGLNEKLSEKGQTLPV